VEREKVEGRSADHKRHSAFIVVEKGRKQGLSSKKLFTVRNGKKRRRTRERRVKIVPGELEITIKARTTVDLSRSDDV